MENISTNKLRTSEIDGYHQTVTFNIGAEEFGINIRKIVGINRLGEVTIDSNSKDQLRGTIISRGKSVPLYDLRVQLGIPLKEYSRKTKFIIVDLGEKLYGIIVDKVNDVLGIPKSEIKSPQSIVSRVNSDYIVSVAKFENRVLKLLDLNKIPNLLGYSKLTGIAV